MSANLRIPATEVADTALNNSNIARARQLLDSTRLRQRQFSRQAAGASLLALLIVIWVPAILIESLFHLPASGRFILTLLAAVSSLGSAAFIWIRLTRNSLINPGRTAEEYWALRLGELASDSERDRLLNAIQISRPAPGSRETPSPELTAEALYRAVSQIENVQIEAATDPLPRKRAYRMAYAASVAILLIFFSSPARFSGAVTRLSHPFTDFQPPPSFRISVTPAGGWAYRGEPVDFQIQVSGDQPKSITFSYSLSGGGETSVDLRLVQGAATAHFEGFPADIDYRVHSGKVTAGSYQLDIVARPQVTELQYKLTPPAYTRLPVQVGRENVGDIEALPGSSAALHIRASKTLKNAALLITETGDTARADSLIMEVSGSEADVSFPISQDGRYVIRLSDRDGHPDRDPVQYRIRILSDEVPAVRIPSPDSDVVLGDDAIVPLRVEAEDDFGLSRWEITFHKTESDTILLHWPLEPPRGARSLALDTLWELGELALMPGDVIEYWATAWDNDNIRGPKKSESERRLVRLPTFEEIVAGVEQTENEATIDAEKALDAAKDLQEEVSKLVEEMRRDPNVNWERQKQLEGALEQQAKLSEQAEQLSKTLDELVNKLEKNNLLTPETLQKYQELQKLIAEITTPELKAAMDKLKQAMDSQDPEAMRQALEDFNLDRDEFQKNIERTMNILQQLKLERKLDELAKRAEELLHAQEQALDKLKAGDQQSAPKEMNTQAAGMEALEREMQDAGKMAEDMGEQTVAENLDSLGKATAELQIPSDMRRTGELARQGQSQKAASQGEENARDLASLSSSLQKMAEQLKQQKKADLANKVRRLVEELLYVSENQEEILRESATIGAQSPRYRDLAGAQQGAYDALAGVADRTIALSQESFFITPELGASLGRGLKGMENAIESFSERVPRAAATSQKQALGEINRSGMQLLAVLGELENSSSSSGYEEMMKKLSEMASAQQSLNGQSMPMPMPGQGGKDGPPMDANTMGKMAAQQRALQQQMEQAAEEAASIQEMLGDLGAIADQMGDVAKDFEDKSVTDRTRRLQQQIVSRLLDATRSAREEEFSKKRESKTGAELSRKSPGPLRLETEQDRLRRDLLRALQEGYSPDYRRLIQRYYESLSKNAPSAR